jgi:hypothetical protein
MVCGSRITVTYILVGIRTRDLTTTDTNLRYTHFSAWACCRLQSTSQAAIPNEHTFARLKLMSYNCRFCSQVVLLVNVSLMPSYEIIIRELGKYCDLIGISDCVCLSVRLSLYWLRCTNTRDLSTRQSILPTRPFFKPSTPAKAKIVGV